MTKKQQSVEDEILSRTRRIETRLTQLLIGLGIGTQTQKPVFDPALQRLELPSPHTSLQEILTSIPPGWINPIELYIKGVRVAVVAP